MLGYKLLNKSKTRHALLVHGLFSSSGFWLPYLNRLRDFRLIILEIDYRAIRNSAAYLRGVEDILETAAGGVADVAIGHSLGTLISGPLARRRCRMSFDICPVYCASRRNTEHFANSLQAMLKRPPGTAEILSMLAEVDTTLEKFDPASTCHATAHRLLPDADPFFDYHCPAPHRLFHGDHFRIDEAMDIVAEQLAP